MVVVRTARTALSALLVGVVGLGMIPTHAQANVVSYNVGDTGPGGGVVFITPSTTGNSTGRFFEVRQAGVQRNACQVPVAIVQATPGIGAGAGNTAAIRAACANNVGNSDSNSAFLWVGAATVGGVADWFIPNPAEADRIQAERATYPTIEAVVNGLTRSVWLSQTAAGTGGSLTDQYLYNATSGSTTSFSSMNAGARSFLIARSFDPTADPSASNADQSPPVVLQQTGVLPGQRCEDLVAPELNWAGVSSGGWGQSWAEWAVPITGGAVCVRELFYDAPRSRWAVRT